MLNFDQIITIGKYTNYSLRNVLLDDPGWILFIIEKSDVNDDIKHIFTEAINEWHLQFGLTFPFGKYKGQPIKECMDKSYLKWICSPKSPEKEIYKWLQNAAKQRISQLGADIVHEFVIYREGPYQGKKINELTKQQLQELTRDTNNTVANAAKKRLKQM